MYLYQPGIIEGGGRRRTTDPIWIVHMHVFTHGIRAYALALKRGFLKEELLIVPNDTCTRMS